MAVQVEAAPILLEGYRDLVAYNGESRVPVGSKSEP